jgi:hypothetical protein
MAVQRIFPQPFEWEEMKGPSLNIGKCGTYYFNKRAIMESRNGIGLGTVLF